MLYPTARTKLSPGIPSPLCLPSQIQVRGILCTRICLPLPLVIFHRLRFSLQSLSSLETERRKNANERVGWEGKNRDETRRWRGRKMRTTLVNISTCIPRLFCTFVYSTWLVIMGLTLSFTWCNVGLNSRNRFFHK